MAGYTSIHCILRSQDDDLPVTIAGSKSFWAQILSYVEAFHLAYGRLVVLLGCPLVTKLKLGGGPGVCLHYEKWKWPYDLTCKVWHLLKIKSEVKQKDSEINSPILTSYAVTGKNKLFKVWQFSNWFSDHLKLRTKNTMLSLKLSATNQRNQWQRYTSQLKARSHLNPSCLFQKVGPVTCSKTMAKRWKE